MKNIRFFKNLAMLIMAMLLCNYSFCQEKTYRIGDLYENEDIKGVVFMVNESGTHGKIISIDETIAPWVAFAGASIIRVGTQKGEIDGSKNMKIIMNASGWQEIYTAANWCYKHGEKWYLPSASELQLIFANKDILNQSLSSIEDADSVFPPKPSKGGDAYSSSNEENESYFIAINYKGKMVPMGLHKTLTGRVRAVCKF